MIETLALVGVPQGFANNAPDDLGPEVVLVIEAVDASHHFGLGEMRIFDVRELVAAGIGQGLNFKEALAGHGVMKLGAGHGVSERNLYGFAIELFGKVDRFSDGF